MQLSDRGPGVGMLSHPVSEENIEWARSMAMQASLKATLDCAKAFSSTDFRGELSAFRVPTLVIHGTSDKTVPIDAAGRPAAKGIAQSQLIEYDGAPHGLFVPEKARLTEDLQAFVRQ
jgi:pimeloyl-ACP methyl ester carboxylesterase